MQKLVKAVFFDLDGTLIDSVPDLALAIDTMLKQLDYPGVGEELVRNWVGNGARVLIQRALAYVESIDEGSVPDSLVDKAQPYFMSAYKAISSRHSSLYPGVYETLQMLAEKGIRMAVITNKPQRFTPDILAGFGIDQFFGLVYCGDSFEHKKPHPQPLLNAMNYFGFSAENCLMVGDSRNDIEAATQAGMKSICVTYGYNHGEDPRGLDAHWHVDNFIDITPLILIN